MKIQTKYDYNEDVLVIINNGISKTRITKIFVKVSEVVQTRPLKRKSKEFEIYVSYNTGARNNVPENQIYKILEDIPLS